MLFASTPAHASPHTHNTHSGKTSLLFHFARAAAAATRRRAFILMTRERADDAPPLLPAGVGKADPAYDEACMK